MLEALPAITVSGVNGVVAVVLGLLTLVMAVGSAVALVRASLVKATVEELRGDRDDLSKRVERLERDVGERDRKIQDLTERLTREQQDREALARVVAGTDMLMKIEEMIRKHDNRVDQIVAQIKAHDDNVAIHHRTTREAMAQALRTVVAEVRKRAGRQGPG